MPDSYLKRRRVAWSQRRRLNTSAGTTVDAWSLDSSTRNSSRVGVLAIVGWRTDEKFLLPYTLLEWESYPTGQSYEVPILLELLKSRLSRLTPFH